MVTKELIPDNPVTTEAESPPDQMSPTTRQRPPIGELLKKLRGTKTLRQVEADTGITNAYLSNLELGLKKPGIKTLAKLSRYYSVPIDHLLRVAGMEEEVPQPAGNEYYSVPRPPAPCRRQTLNLLRVAGMEEEVPQPAGNESVMDIQRAFDFVITDPNIAPYEKPADALPLDMQKFVVHIYQHYTGRKLL